MGISFPKIISTKKEKNKTISHCSCASHLISKKASNSVLASWDNPVNRDTDRIKDKFIRFKNICTMN